MRRAVAGTAAVCAAAAVAAGLGVAGGGADAGRASPGPPVGARATVERRDLVDRDTVDGTLGYAGEGRLTAGATGTVTRLRRPGAVVRRGGWLYDLDGAHAAFLLYGRLPAWRDFAPGMADGDDVRQLERNLRALGHDPDGDMAVDGSWDWATTAAVVRFQRARGLERDGTLSRGEVVFRRGATRIGAHSASVGDAAAPGARLAAVSSTRRRVTVDLPATRRQLARRGDTVTVELPTGKTVRGRIMRVGTVAEPSSEDAGEPTIEVTITLRGRRATGSGLDQAPVDVGLAVERRRGVLTVPVKALLVREGGGIAVEVIRNGRRRLVAVRTGVYADGLVEVDGDLREGETVVTAR